MYFFRAKTGVYEKLELHVFLSILQEGGGVSGNVSMFPLNPPLIQAKSAQFVAINVLRSFSKNLVKLSS